MITHGIEIKHLHNAQEIFNTELNITSQNEIR